MDRKDSQTRPPFTQTLKCGFRFHGVITYLSDQSRGIFSRDWIASEIAVHDCASVNLFLSSRSQCSFGFPKWILRCMFQWNKNEFSWFTHPLGQNASRFLKSLICHGPNMKVSCTQICFVLHLLSSESDPFFRQTPTCLVVSLMVYSLL